MLHMFVQVVELSDYRDSICYYDSLGLFTIVIVDCMPDNLTSIILCEFVWNTYVQVLPAKIYQLSI